MGAFFMRKFMLAFLFVFTLCVSSMAFASSAEQNCDIQEEVSKETIDCPHFDHEWAMIAARSKSMRHKYWAVKKYNDNTKILNAIARGPYGPAMLKYFPRTKIEYTLSYADLFEDEVYRKAQETLIYAYQNHTQFDDIGRFYNTDILVKPSKFYYSVLKKHMSVSGNRYKVHLGKSTKIPYTGLRYSAGVAFYWYITQPLMIELQGANDSSTYYQLNVKARLQRQLSLSKNENPHKLIVLDEKYQQIPSIANMVVPFQEVTEKDFSQISDVMEEVDPASWKCENAVKNIAWRSTNMACPQIHEELNIGTMEKFGHLRVNNLYYRGSNYLKIPLNVQDISDDEIRDKATKMLLSMYQYREIRREYPRNYNVFVPLSEQMKQVKANTKNRTLQHQQDKFTLHAKDVNSYLHFPEDEKKMNYSDLGPDRLPVSFIADKIREDKAARANDVWHTKAALRGELEFEPLKPVKRKEGIILKRAETAHNYQWEVVLPITLELYKNDKLYGTYALNVSAAIRRMNYLHPNHQVAWRERPNLGELYPHRIIDMHATEHVPFLKQIFD